jgi:FeS assembly SUF system regulator
MRLTHLADYAVVLMTAAARYPAGARLSATALSTDTGVPLPTAQKLMGQLAASGLLTSVRGAGGGFALARPAGAISLADIVEAVEGPIALTMCSDSNNHECALDKHCRVKPHMGVVGHAVRGALGAVSLQQLCSPAQAGVQSGQERVWAPAFAGAQSK